MEMLRGPGNQIKPQMNRKLFKEVGLRDDVSLERIVRDPGADDPRRITEFEELLGQSLPDDYRRFVLELAPCLFEEMSAYRAIEPNPWSDDGLNRIDEFFGLDELIQHYSSSSEELPSGMFAIACDGGASNILLSLNDPVGQVFFEDKDSREIYLCANTFTEFLQSFERVPEEELPEE